ncbi:MAG: DEAD/DEAH box helicase [bacterium]|nr:DEAD/DEAH box helicase [bacterium]
MTVDQTVAELFERVRAACKPADWSRGVDLSRGHGVTVERIEDDEIRFQISRSGGLIGRTVSLFPEDLEWDCGCPNADEGCEHVAAAVITWKRSHESGGAMPAARAPTGAVGYRLDREGERLTLSRVIAAGETDHPLNVTLAAVVSGRADLPPAVVSQADLAVDLALGTHRRGPIGRNLISRLFARLAGCSDLSYRGATVEVSADPVLPRARIEDLGDGFRLSIGDAPEVSEVFSNGAVLCGSTLRPVGESKLTGRELDELPRGRYFTPDQAGELISEVLPDLERRIPVDILTERLPSTTRIAPRIQLDVSREEHSLAVLPTLVYGDPPTARIDAGRLVHLRGPVPLRDESEEKRLLHQLRRELHLSPGVRAVFDGADAVDFFARLESWKAGIRGTAHEFFRKAPPLVPRLQLDEGGFAIEFSATRGAESAGSADPAAVLAAWSRGEPLVPLLEGGWSPLPADWLERYGHRVADLLAARDEATGQLPGCALPDLARLCEELEQPPPPEFEQLRELVGDFEALPIAGLPDDLVAELRSYQQRGVDWLRFLRRAGLGALLADDMGLGKTLQALCAIEGRTLVVAPTSVLHNWADEARRFRPGLRCHVYHGVGRKLDPEADLTLTTYALLRIDADLLTEERWDSVVLDEAQAIKNPDSRVAAAAYRLQADFKVALTGTPVENRLEELWSQLHFINRGLLGGREDFRRRYGQPIAEGEAEPAARLRERIRPFVLRRLKRDVAPELPPRTEMLLHCELDEREREIYESIRMATRDDVVKLLSGGGSVIAALEALLRLRQAACHPGLLPGHDAPRSSKLDLLLDTLDSIVAEGHKALVFSQWTSYLDLAEPLLAASGIPYLRLDGTTRDRAGVVRAFQDSSGPPILLISLKAGGTGLNLTAADHVFLLDPWWNPAVEDQAADRAHRIGQDRPVMVYRLVAEDTVEERILLLQQKKREIAEAALGEAAAATGITREDLLGLLA